MSLLHTNKTKACGKAEASSIRLLLALIFVSCFLCSCTVEHTLSHCRLNCIRCLFADWLSLSVDRLSVCSHVCLQYNVHALSLRVHSSVCVSVPGLCGLHETSLRGARWHLWEHCSERNCAELMKEMVEQTAAAPRARTARQKQNHDRWRLNSHLYHILFQCSLVAETTLPLQLTSNSTFISLAGDDLRGTKCISRTQAPWSPQVDARFHSKHSSVEIQRPTECMFKINWA